LLIFLICKFVSRRLVALVFGKGGNLIVPYGAVEFLSVVPTTRLSQVER